MTTFLWFDFYYSCLKRPGSPMEKSTQQQAPGIGPVYNVLVKNQNERSGDKSHQAEQPGE